ncbi:MAG TPA: DNRLRE domain-containing protein [Bacteroidota bacterium]|nr:DNRLRE domain-containing protein [Bacteroidota bacterium]
MRTATPLTLLAALLLTQAGCSDDPNASGAQLLPDSLNIVTLTTAATSDTNYLTRVGGNQGTLLVGTAPGFEARTLLRFSFPSFDTTSRIDSGVIKLRVSYRLPDSGGAVSFAIHAMTASWGNASFRWDSIPNSFDPAASGAFAGSVSAGDTLVRVKVDTALLRSWLRARTGSLMMIPDAGQATVIGFHSHLQVSAGLQPVLEISYRGAADTTLKMTRNAIEGVFVADGPVPVQDGLTVLQSGVAYRGRFRFDSLALPAGVSISRAYLEVTPNPGLPTGPGASRDTLTVSFVQDRAFPLDSIVLSGLCYPVTVNGSRIYRADIKTYVQLWNTRESNYGIVLRTLGELTTLDRFGLYNSSAADSLRPLIRITYTQFP